VVNIYAEHKRLRAVCLPAIGVNYSPVSFSHVDRSGELYVLVVPSLTLGSNFG
jgi:hypothetical protein